jgi:transcriptional regulator with XRE-family HTH domain
METKQYKAIGQAIADTRKNNGLTQLQVCAKMEHVVGMTQGRFSRLERGHWLPTAGQFEHIIRAIQCTEDQARELRYLAAQACERLTDAAC